MVQTLELRLLGLPAITIAGEPVHALLANKARALLFYLAVNGQTHPRDTLSYLLWPEATDEQARRNLRELLFASRKWLSPYLIITRHTLAFNRASAYWLDVEQFRRNLHHPHTNLDIPTLLEAIALYQGEFLQGFAVREASSFEEWMSSQRTQLAELLAQALEALSDQHLARGDYKAGLEITQRLLTLEPWRESAHRQQMLLLACNNQRSAALAQYAVCQRTLQEEYGAPPAAETVALYERIRLDGLASVASSAPQTEASPRTSISTEWVNWNAIPKLCHFYGRRQELDLLHRWVGQENQRLIALFGLGGQGKSALVAEFVRELAATSAPSDAKPAMQDKASKRPKATQGRFSRVLWRSLKEAPPLAELVKSWLQTLNHQACSALPNYVDAQIDCLIDTLRQQPCLLILDQVEALMQTGRRAGCYRPESAAYADLFRRILENQHRSCLVLLSRERPIDFSRLETQATGMQMLPLSGLALNESRELLQSQGVSGSLEVLTQLIWRYSGHPLALTQVAKFLRECFGGDLSAFLQSQALIFDELRELLDQQFERLLPLEQEMLCLVARERRTMTLQEVCSEQFHLSANPLAHPGDNLEAVRSLSRRGMLEQRQDGFALPALLATYLATCQLPSPGLDSSAVALPMLALQPSHKFTFTPA